MHDFPVSRRISKAGAQSCWGCAGDTSFEHRVNAPARLTCLMYRLIPSISKPDRGVNPNNRCRYSLKSGHTEQNDTQLPGHQIWTYSTRNFREARKGNRTRHQQEVMRTSQACQSPQPRLKYYSLLTIN